MEEIINKQTSKTCSMSEEEFWRRKVRWGKHYKGNVEELPSC